MTGIGKWKAQLILQIDIVHVDAIGGVVRAAFHIAHPAHSRVCGLKYHIAPTVVNLALISGQTRGSRIAKYVY